MPRIGKTALKDRLEELYRSFDPSMISPDPLEVVRRYDRPEDQEIAGLVAASLAYGRAELITSAAGEVLRRMGDAPWDFVQRYDPRRDGEVFDGFVYRWSRGRDFSILVALMQKALGRHGSWARSSPRATVRRTPIRGPHWSISLKRSSVTRRRITLRSGTGRKRGSATSCHLREREAPASG